MIHKAFCISILLTAALFCSAQENTTERPRLSGYFMGQYQATLKDKGSTNGFSIRMARLAMDGRFQDVLAYKIQGQVSGNASTLSSSTRLVDAFAEWQRYDFMRIKVGQFKRPFSFENPMNPIDQGFMSYSQVVNCLAGFTDRSGCHSSNGRDIGLQLQGDVMLGKTIIHYQVGMFNGQGINMKDEDNMKDIIGGIWVSPLKGLRIGAFGWTGSYARNGSWTNEQGNTETGRRSLKQERYAFGAEYKNNGWQMRSEYIHSTGWGFSTTHQDTEDMKKADIDTDKGNKADGLYALVMAPMVKNRLWLKARYDMYRKTAQWSSARTQYEIGVNCILWKNIEIQTEYAFVNDRNINPSNYSMVDCELCVRF